ncbi:MAG: hypothetical protein ACRYGK_07820 [Janthinobacterium lividum]
MNIKPMSNAAIAELVGNRLQELRLKTNVGQDEIAREAGISRQTLYQLLTHGKGTLTNLIAVLRTLGELDRLSSLTAQVRPSPLAIARMAGKTRTRATGSRGVAKVSRSADEDETNENKKDVNW